MKLVLFVFAGIVGLVLAALATWHGSYATAGLWIAQAILNFGGADMADRE